MQINRLRLALVVIQGGFAFSCFMMGIQGMNPINSVAPALFGWSQEQTQLNYGMASSVALLGGLVTMAYPSFYLYKKLGRLNSLRIAHALNIIGCSLMIMRRTEGLIAGRLLIGIAMGILIFSAIPYVINFLPDSQKYFYGSIAVIISRTGPLFHALSARFYDPATICDDDKYMLTIFFPAIVSTLSILLSVANNYDSPDSLFTRGVEEADLQTYYCGFLTKQTIKALYDKLRGVLDNRPKDYPLLDYFIRPGLREKFLVGCLMILIRHWSGTIIHVIYLWYTLNRFYDLPTATTYNYLIIASDILVVAFSSIFFFHFSRIKPVWLLGCLLAVFLNSACAILVLVDIIQPIRFLLWAMRSIFSFSIQVILFNYLARILPATGYSFCYSLFFLLGFVGAQSILPMIKISFALPFFIFAGVPLVCMIPFIFLMKEADQYEPIQIEPIIPGEVVVSHRSVSEASDPNDQQPASLDRISSQQILGRQDQIQN